MTKKAATTRTLKFFLDETGILHSEVIDGVTIDIDDAVDNLLVARSLCNGQARLKLTDARAHWKITKEAREYWAKEDTAKHTIARAIIVRSVWQKLFLTWRLKTDIHQSVFRAFLSEKDAVQWLMSFPK